MTILPEVLDALRTQPSSATGPVDTDRLGVLEQTLTACGAPATVVRTLAGPQVDTVVLRVGPETRVRAIRAALPDVAMRLGVGRVRLDDTFDTPGQVMLEVPRATAALVTLRDVLLEASGAPRPTPYELPWVVGLAPDGTPVIRDLATAPHVLMSGATGSGKSVAMVALATGLSCTVAPEDCEILLIDTKRVGLGSLVNSPLLRRKLIQTPERALRVIRWLSELVMRRRYEVFRQAGVTDLAAFNAVQSQRGLATRQRLVIMIDELADLVTTEYGKEIEKHLIAIAQMGRAAGLHLVCATQRPSAAVLSTQLRSQLPTRLTFALASAADSRVAMDEPGAEKLLGHGDGLLKWVGQPTQRVQGAYVSNEEAMTLLGWLWEDLYEGRTLPMTETEGFRGEVFTTDLPAVPVVQWAPAVVDEAVVMPPTRDITPALAAWDARVEKEEDLARQSSQMRKMATFHVLNRKGLGWLLIPFM